MRRLAVLLLLLFATPVAAQTPALLDRALDAAIDTFETALPRLARSEMGVDVAAYRDALTLQRFASSHWGGTITLALVSREAPTGSCTRYAAFLRMPPENGTLQLVLCPQFYSPGADALRELTLLHEVVHAVAGPDECRAMAFAARIEQVAHGRFTPVDAYWRANGCAGSGFRLP